VLVKLPLFVCGRVALGAVRFRLWFNINLPSLWSGFYDTHNTPEAYVDGLLGLTGTVWDAEEVMTQKEARNERAESVCCLCLCAQALSWTKKAAQRKPLNV
jgi:hypothetical protein